MITVNENIKVHLFTEPVDMRKGFDGLSALVRQHEIDLFSGELFVFISTRGDRIKILTWDRGGLALWYKRLERGRFKRVKGSGTLQLDKWALQLLLEGLDPHDMKRPARWSPRVG